MTFLTPVKLSWSFATYHGEAGDVACRTSTVGLHGQAPPEKPHEDAHPKARTTGSLYHITEYSVMPNAARQATTRSSILTPGSLLMPVHFPTLLKSC